MKRLSNGDVLYRDDFWFNQLFFVILIVLCVPAAWFEIGHGRLLVGSSLIGLAVIAALSLITASRRSYLFSPSKALVMRTEQSLFKRVEDSAAFADVALTVQARPQPPRTGWLANLGIRGTHEYDLLLVTPAWRAVIWTSFQNDADNALREAKSLRAVLGQNPYSILEESVTQMLLDGNPGGALLFQREAGVKPALERIR